MSYNKSFKSIKIIGLNKSFSEFRKYNVLKFKSPEEFFEYQEKNDKSYYEILSDYVKPFFDVENVTNPTRIHELFEYIKDRFKTCFNFDVTDYVITKNEHSSNHIGLSYHIIIQKCCIKLDLLDSFVKQEFKTFRDCVDFSIYHNNRLFRTINSYGITKDNTKDMNSVHKLYEYTGNENVAKINSIISYTKDCFNNILFSTNYEKNHVNKIYPKNKLINWSENTIRNRLLNYDIENDDIISPLKKYEDIIDEKDLYGKIIVLLEFPLKDVSKKLLLEIKEYYDINKSFEKFRFELKQIKYLIKLIEKQC